MLEAILSLPFGTILIAEPRRQSRPLGVMTIPMCGFCPDDAYCDDWRHTHCYRYHADLNGAHKTSYSAKTACTRQPRYGNGLMGNECSLAENWKFTGSGLTNNAVQRRTMAIVSIYPAPAHDELTMAQMPEEGIHSGTSDKCMFELNGCSCGIGCSEGTCQ